MTKLNVDRSLLMAEFTLLAETTREYLGLYLKCVGIYFAVMVAIVSVFFGVDANESLRLALFLMGACLTLAAWTMTEVGNRAYRLTASRCKEVGSTLCMPDVYSKPAMLVGKGFRVVFAVIFFAWFGMLRLV